MNRILKSVGALALASVTVSATAQGQASTRLCLSGPEAEAVFLAIAPAALKAAGGTCETALPATAFLLRPDPAFTARMVAAADAAWPRARDAVARMAGPDLAPMFKSDAMRPTLGVLVAARIVAELKPADCPKLDRLLTLLAPLPSRNIAGLGVTILQYAQEDAVRRGKKAALPLCRTPA